MLIVRKLAGAGLTIFVIVMLGFFIFRAMPGDPERMLIGSAKGVTPEMLTQIRARWGLDRPLFPDQFISYLLSVARGDFGYSFKFRGATVLDVIGPRVMPTLLLVGIAQVIAIAAGLWIGACAGWRPGSVFDRLGSSLALGAYGMPTFWLGMVLLIVFASWLRWFPVTGLANFGNDDSIGEWSEIIRRSVLPIATVAIAQTGQYALLMRAAVVEVSKEDFVTTARAKGIGSNAVLRRHLVPNARLPIVTLISLNLGFIVAGAVTVEAVFSWPGLGLLTVEAMRARDYPVLQALFMIFAVSTVLVNMVADLLYTQLDPRVSR
ncbi:ABC transporter permease [Sinorhizobium meliloti]|uniref:ABC transporter permease n=1 Tax=Rhizobium meliloti TaxID=382 RepID=UPI000FD757D1|nr:ABC transporter permease [Sinorhizobium meliloti]MDX0500471.1 ABC transporter permease subunit [Sinorhizobium medicae]RVE84378.1 ABC transporter permease [Sinorhizobium meliloti]